MAKKPSKQYVEFALDDCLHKFRALGPDALEVLIQTMMATKGYGRDEVIRKLARFETDLTRLLEAIRRVDEA